jgi:hypothetical protein
MEAKTPAKRALAALDTQPAPAEPIAQRRISKKVRSGIEFMVSGDCKTIKDAAEKAGLSREHFTRELSKPRIAEHLRKGLPPPRHHGSPRRRGERRVARQRERNGQG